MKGKEKLSNYSRLEIKETGKQSGVCDPGWILDQGEKKNLFFFLLNKGLYWYNSQNLSKVYNYLFWQISNNF
jgi:hypothetical protein